MAKATIDDVAALAGVSIKTVSRVVNNEPNVRPATREKVESAIAALDYRPNQSARSLAGNRSYLLGLIYGHPSAHYVLDIQEGVLEICRPQRYDPRGSCGTAGAGSHPSTDHRAQCAG